MRVLAGAIFATLGDFAYAPTMRQAAAAPTEEEVQSVIHANAQVMACGALPDAMRLAPRERLEQHL